GQNSFHRKFARGTEWRAFLSSSRIDRNRAQDSDSQGVLSIKEHLHMSQGTPSQPNLTELMARYLRDQAGSHLAGLGKFDPSREVLPFEAGPVQAVDPLPAWQEAISVLPFYAPSDLD